MPCPKNKQKSKWRINIVNGKFKVRSNEISLDGYKNSAILIKELLANFEKNKHFYLCLTEIISYLIKNYLSV